MQHCETKQPSVMHQQIIPAFANDIAVLYTQLRLYPMFCPVHSQPSSRFPWVPYEFPHQHCCTVAGTVSAMHTEEGQCTLLYCLPKYSNFEHMFLQETLLMLSPCIPHS